MAADFRIWPDDTRRAAVTLALAATTDSDTTFEDVIASVEDGVNSGRSVAYVMALIGELTAGLGEQFSNPAVAAGYRQLAAKSQAHQDDLRARNDWRNE
jgi:hypothetical protein